MLWSWVIINLNKYFWRKLKMDDATYGIILICTKIHNWFFRLSIKVSFMPFCESFRNFSNIVWYYKIWNSPYVPFVFANMSPYLISREYSPWYRSCRSLERKVLQSYSFFLSSSLSLCNPFIFLIAQNIAKNNQGVTEFLCLMGF